MELLELLPPEHLIVPLRATDLRGAVLELARRLHEQGAVRDLAALEERIARDPIREIPGLADEVVLPHYRSDEVDRLALAVGVSRHPLEGPTEGLSARVVGLVLAPPEAAALYLQTSSTLARVFQQPGLVDAVVSQDDAAGIRSLPALQGVRVQHSLVVRDVMAHQVHSVPPDATVRRTLDLMLRRSLQAIPVVDEAGSVLGMVTESDVMRALLPKIARAEPTGEPDRADPQERPVREIMSRSVLCVSEDLGVGDVASMMINKDVEQLPVVDAGAIAGMVYRRDIIRKLFGRA